MIQIRKQILLLLMLGFFGVIQAQDIHYSMFDLAPIQLNAANTGNFAGTFRIGGIYRGQWTGLNTNTGLTGTSNFKGFNTPSAYIDVPFTFSKKNPIRSWFGVGLSFLSDKAGMGGLSTMGGSLALAYHLGLGANGNTRISIGARGGLAQQRVDASVFSFEDGIITGNTSIDNNLASDAVSYADFSAGLQVTHLASTWNVTAGFAANHISRPKYNFLGTDAQLPMGLVGNLTFNFNLGQKFLLRPMAFYQYMSRAQETNLQALFGIHFNDAKDVTFLVGGGYRLGDAAIGRIGLELKGLRFGFAYDFNLSSLSQTNGRAQAFEVGISYIAKLYKKPLIKEILFCPRF